MQLLFSWIQEGMPLLHKLVYYATALFFVFLATIPPRMSEARFALIILVTTSFMAERFLHMRLLAHDYSPVMHLTVLW